MGVTRSEQYRSELQMPCAIKPIAANRKRRAASAAALVCLQEISRVNNIDYVRWHMQMLHTVTEQILASPNVLHWFAQNACGRYEQRLRRCHVEPRWAKKLVAIPIGLDMHTLMVSGHESWDSRGRRTIRQQTSELDEIVSRCAYEIIVAQ